MLLLWHVRWGREGEGGGVCVFVFVCSFACLYVFSCVFVFVCMFVRVFVFVCVCLCVCLCVCICLCVYLFIYFFYTSFCMSTYIYLLYTFLSQHFEMYIHILYSVVSSPKERKKNRQLRGTSVVGAWPLPRGRQTVPDGSMTRVPPERLPAATEPHSLDYLAIILLVEWLIRQRPFHFN